MNVAREKDMGTYTDLMAGYSSYVSPDDGHEWVVFSQKKLALLYVMRVRKGRHRWRDHGRVHTGCGADQRFRHLTATAIEATSAEKARFQVFRRDLYTVEGMTGLIEAEVLGVLD